MTEYSYVVNCENTRPILIKTFDHVQNAFDNKGVARITKHIIKLKIGHLYTVAKCLIYCLVHMTSSA